MQIRWLTASIGHPAAAIVAATAFWRSVAGSALSERRSAAGDLGPLPATDGDASHLRIQPVDGDPRISLELHVDSVPEARRLAEGLGARTLSHGELAAMQSPGGFEFCIAPYGAMTSPPTAPGDSGCRVDQVCLDIPTSGFDREAEFWAQLTGWERRSGRLEEFEFLVRPVGMPLRILLQRLGDSSGPVRAHLDLACGARVVECAAAHERLGAKLVRVRELWTTMCDPAGLEYCLTARDPVTGTVTSANDAPST